MDKLRSKLEELQRRKELLKGPKNKKKRNKVNKEIEALFSQLRVLGLAEQSTSTKPPSESSSIDDMDEAVDYMVLNTFFSVVFHLMMFYYPDVHRRRFPNHFRKWQKVRSMGRDDVVLFTNLEMSVGDLRDAMTDICDICGGRLWGDNDHLNKQKSDEKLSEILEQTYESVARNFEDLSERIGLDFMLLFLSRVRNSGALATNRIVRLHTFDSWWYRAHARDQYRAFQWLHAMAFVLTEQERDLFTNSRLLSVLLTSLVKADFEADETMWIAESMNKLAAGDNIKLSGDSFVCKRKHIKLFFRWFCKMLNRHHSSETLYDQLGAAINLAITWTHRCYSNIEDFELMHQGKPAERIMGIIHREKVAPLIWNLIERLFPLRGKDEAIDICLENSLEYMSDITRNEEIRMQLLQILDSDQPYFFMRQLGKTVAFEKERPHFYAWGRMASTFGHLIWSKPWMNLLEHSYGTPLFSNYVRGMILWLQYLSQLPSECESNNYHGDESCQRGVRLFYIALNNILQRFHTLSGHWQLFAKVFVNFTSQHTCHDVECHVCNTLWMLACHQEFHPELRKIIAQGPPHFPHAIAACTRLTFDRHEHIVDNQAEEHINRSMDMYFNRMLRLWTIIREAFPDLKNRLLQIDDSYAMMFTRTGNPFIDEPYYIEVEEIINPSDFNSVDAPLNGGLTLLLCNACGERESHVHEFKMCRRCKKVFYCSKKCQKSDWKVHKKMCKKIENLE